MTTKDIQFPNGANYLEKMGHWALLGGAPKDQPVLTQNFCKVANILLNMSVTPTLVLHDSLQFMRK